MTGETGSGRNNSASLTRGLDILTLLGGVDAEGLPLSAIAAELDMNKSTAHRLLSPLIDARLVERGPDGRRYRLGWRTAALGQAYVENLDLRRLAHAELAELAERTGETTHLVIPDLPSVVYVDKVDSAQPVRMYSRVGLSQYAYCTAVGKAILAFAESEAVARVIEHGLRARTDKTITDAIALRAELARVRDIGYAVDDIENEPEVRCVAAAVFDHAGRIAGAISVSGPASRVTSDRVPSLGPDVARTASNVSTRMGAADASSGARRDAVGGIRSREPSETVDACGRRPLPRAVP